MALIDGLVSYWRLDEVYTAATWVDSHGPNNLSRSNTAASLPSAKMGAGFDSNVNGSSSSFLSISNASQVGLDITGSFSISFWLNLPVLSTTGLYGGLPSKYTSEGYRVYSGDAASSIALQTTGATGGIHTTSGTFTFVINRWYFIMATYNTSDKAKRIYINSSTAIGSGTASHSNALKQTTDSFDIGHLQNASSATLRTRIDEVGFWNRALTSDEFNDLYNNGCGLSYPFQGSALKFRS